MVSISYNHAFKIAAATLITGAVTSRLAGKACEYINTKIAKKTQQEAPLQKATPKQNKMIKIASALIGLAAGAFTANHLGVFSLKNLLGRMATTAGLSTLIFSSRVPEMDE